MVALLLPPLFLSLLLVMTHHTHTPIAASLQIAPCKLHFCNACRFSPNQHHHGYEREREQLLHCDEAHPAGGLEAGGQGPHAVRDTVSLCARLYMCVVYACVFVYTCIHVCVHVYLCVHVCVYMCVCV